uniref:xanthine dehydrogenase n=1 Tax=Laticauda laticaudata TaxID=8630 RepID=A0A8C5T4Q8_LATLA
MISKVDNSRKKIIHYSANACLFPICALHHVAVTTVEGIGSTKTRLHPVQERIAKSHGSQCGFCTPGIVMSMYTLLRNHPQPKMEEIEDAFQGKITPVLLLIAKKPEAYHSLEIVAAAIMQPFSSPSYQIEIACFVMPCFYMKLNLQLCFKGERVMWLQPSTLKELVSLKAQHSNAKLVVGNTEVGSFGQIAPVSGFTGIRFGASCSLSYVEEELREAVAHFPPYQVEVFQAVLEQLRWFAGPQIRNVAVSALGGNIMTASPISDLNPVLMASGSKLTLVSNEGSRTIRMDEKFFTGYRKTILKPQEILISVEIPFSREGEYFSAFKQASRREDDIAIVTCGMRVQFQEGTNRLEEIKLSYGGMAPTTVMAVKTCQKLIGREWKEDLLQEACRLLAEEMNLSPSAPGGMVDFRRTLVLSFFFKFYLTVLQKHVKLNGNVSFSEVPNEQSIDDMVGRPLMHLSAAKQASGEAVYCDDIPSYTNELYLTLVTSSKAHAKIISIDTTEAQNVPGFVCFVSNQDVPGSNTSGICNDETIFVTCVGHIIGAVLADTQEHSRRAAKAVKILYEELTPIITIQEAIEKESFFKTDRKIEKGNIKKGFEEADHIVEGEMHIGGQEHFYLETHCTIAVPKGEDGEMELFVSTQNLAKTQDLVANALGVPANRILVRVKRMGGGFGGKESRSIILSTVVAVAAAKTGCPVRCMLDRDEDMLISGGRHPFWAQYKVGFKKNGRITSLDTSYYSNGGNSVDLSHGVMDRAVLHMDNSYNIPNIRGIGVVCKTNLASNTAFRGFGGPQGMMVAETEVCPFLFCSEKVRKINLYSEGDLTHFNQKLEGFTLKRCWEECLAKSKYHSRRTNIEKFNQQNRWKKRGIAITPTKFGISFTVPFLNQAGALIHVYTDGSVLLTHGGTEMGQGLHTKMIQVASKTLGIPTSKIHISETSTNTVPNTSPTAASVSADINGMAVFNACQTILERLKPFRCTNPKGLWQDWVCFYLVQVEV